MMVSGFHPKSFPRLFVFGDSISQGSDYYYPLPDRNGYAYMIAKARGWQLINLAVGGTKIADDGQFGNITRAPITSDDRVIFLTGYNDMRFVGTDSTAQTAYQTKLNECLDVLQAKGATVYVGNCLKMPTAAYATNSPYNVGSDTAVGQFNTKIAAAVSGRPKFTLVDISSSFNPNTGANMGGDQVHPSLVGAQVIANYFMSVMS